MLLYIKEHKLQMNTKDNLRFKIYRAIRKEDCIPFKEFSPDIIINKGKYEFFGEDAEDLIFNSAKAINLPIKYFAEYFPYAK